jgi:hypothetical protein
MVPCDRPSTRSMAQSSRWRCGEAARRNRHRHRTQQGGQQGHQVEEFLGPLQRLLHLGPAAFERLQAQPAHAGLLQFGLGPGGRSASPPASAPATARR